jgi:large subunit ribosomal protein L25
VLYGHNLEPRHLTLPGHEVLLALRTANVLIRLEGLPGGAQLALPKAIQRDPIRGYVEHVDLLVVRRGEKVTVDVPINVSGEVAPDGLLDQQLIQITVEGTTLAVEPEILVLHVIPAPTAEQIEAEIGEAEPVETVAGTAAEGEGAAEAPADSAGSESAEESG